MSTVCFRDRAEQRVFFCIFLHYYVCIILASVINHNQAGFTVSGMRLNDRIPVIKYLSDIFSFVICRYDYKKSICLCFQDNSPVGYSADMGYLLASSLVISSQVTPFSTIRTMA